MTCPCAFALATPLALSISLGRCAREGVLIKGADVIERLSLVDGVLFDKTGTLTVGKYAVQSWDPELRFETDSDLVRPSSLWNPNLAILLQRPSLSV